VRFRKARPDVAAEASFPGYGSVVEIASGALARVYRAVELGTSRPVALKLLRLGDASQSALEPLDEQLDMLTLLSKHPNITTLYRTFFTPEGLPVLVTELCRESLAQRLARTGPLPPATVVPIAIKIAGALETAHKAGLVHGDVKPENILISAVGEPLLGDLGLASLQAAAEPMEHLAGEITVHTAPEAFEEAPVTPAVDVYGLASTMYLLLLGRGPFVTFPGEEPASIILRLLRDPAPRPPLGSMPIALADLLEAALAKGPASRPASAAEFAGSLRSIEEASGWPPTVYIVWEISELSGARPLRPATLAEALKDGEEPDQDGPDLGGVEPRSSGEVEVDIYRVASDEVLVDAAAAEAVAPGRAAGEGAAEVPGYEVTGYEVTGYEEPGYEVTGYEVAMNAGSPEGQEAQAEKDGGQGFEEGGQAGPAAGTVPGEPAEPDAAPVVGADETAVNEAADVDGRARPGGGPRPAGGPAPEEPPAKEGAPVQDAASVAEGGAGGQGPATSGPTRDAPGPQVTRRVIMPPPVERTVVVPPALPPQRAATSQPAHAVQTYPYPGGYSVGHSAGSQRPAG